MASPHNEAVFKSRLVSQCIKLGWYARRIEDQYGVGVLDIIVVPRGYHTLFIEGKITDGMVFRPTERQYIEGMQVNKAGGNGIAILAGWRNEVMHIADWGREAYITKAFRQPDGKNYAETIEDWIRWKTKL